MNNGRCTATSTALPEVTGDETTDASDLSAVVTTPSTGSQNRPGSEQIGVQDRVTIEVSGA